ncbi:MAG: UDP-N-acetylmuramoyl-L-alanine--D-glutamate ligase, partial [Anaeroplasmataceae bacterium]|nr:UDP-N-acetylmuramoyl-L-alanine--D-glutamate ligase [Anaeroplasmataceae bacterium]
MKILVLGKGVANDGVVLLLKEEQLEYDYLNLDEVEEYEYDLVVKAPGIPLFEPVVEKFLENKIRVITDIELAFMLRKKFYIGVTGSNGKTTTVSLIAHILSAKFDVVACGNIGYSVCRALVEHPNADIFVVELSSFQLESAQIDLNISVLLNAHPCHLDHHGEYKRYLESKSNICKNQSASHYCVYHLDDPMIRDMVKLTGAKRISFSRTSYLAKSYLHKNFLYYDKKRILQSKESKTFMQENQLAAIAAASLIKGMCPRLIRKQIESFEEIEYRLTKVNDFIYNDAKSTNPYATIAALDCLENVELLCGGYDRKENLSCLQDSLSKIKRVYAYGDTKYKIKEYMDSH